MNVSVCQLLPCKSLLKHYFPYVAVRGVAREIDKRFIARNQPIWLWHLFVHMASQQTGHFQEEPKLKLWVYSFFPRISVSYDSNKRLDKRNLEGFALVMD